MNTFRWGEYKTMTFLLNQRIEENRLTLLFLSDSRSFPFVIACTCLFLQIIQVILYWINTFEKPGSVVVETEPSLADTPASSFLHSVKKNVKGHGGWTIYCFMVARLLGCLVLFTLSLKSLLSCQRNNFFVKCPETFITMTFFYSTLMAIISITVKTWSVSATRYNIIVLLSVFGVYLYRDIWPLATFSQEPKDLQEGYMLWVKFSIITLIAVIIPLFIPRKYVPVDPKDPMPEPNPEQTCSLFALMFFTYLDPVIILGYRVPHLRFDQLPPLSDSDYSKHITRNAFPHLDPHSGAERRHLFFSLMHVFRMDFMILSVCIIGQMFAIFASPIGINRLLNYLETGGKDAFVRPWFWIFCLLAGKIIMNICVQWYLFVSTRTLVRTEGLLTQLVFEHTLRIRLKAEPSNEENEEDNVTVVGTPDSASVVEGRAIDSNSDEGASESHHSPEVVPRDSPSDTQSTSKARVNTGDKDDPSIPKSGSKQASKGKRDAHNLIGKVNNLVTTDLANIVAGRDFLMLVLYVPLQTLLFAIFLYNVLGWSAFVGLATMFALFPIPGYINKKAQEVQVQRMKMTDARVQDVVEAVNVLRMIKFFGWERRMSEKIGERRNDELGWLWKLKVLETLNWITSNTVPTIVMLVTYATYTVIMKQELTASKIFSSMTVFSLLKLQLQRVSLHLSSVIQAKVSLDRMTEFLQKTELLDSFADKPSDSIVPTTIECEDDIGFRNATFSWSTTSGSSMPSDRAFRLHISGDLLFKRDCINLIIGPTGSGKTSILMALLGEMHFIPTTSDAWFNLPRKGGVAYAAQESWVQNETIRNNILFCSAYDEVRYRKVIHQCALERDLELFDAGDQTEVGERGLTLSGGQRARVTLARAIYSSAEILLLDDILAALDVHTASWIIDRCLRGDLVKGRTVLLVTNNVALAVPIAQHVVSIGQDGTVRSQAVEHSGTALVDDLSLVSETEQVPRTVIEDVEPRIKKDNPMSGKLVIAEEIAKGHITWKSLKLYLSGLGGDYPLFFFSIWLSGTILTDWVNTFQVWFLGYWGSQYETNAPFEVNAVAYLTQYSLVLFTMVVIYTASYIFYVYGSIGASRRISASLIDSVLRASLRWLDETPTGRIISRCTQDLRVVDSPIPLTFVILTETGITILTKIVVIVIFSPIFVFPTMAVAISAFYLGNLYLRSQLSVKREMSNARSPLLAHFSAAVAGIVSIRAYGAQVSFKTESLTRVDHYIRVARISYNLGRWINTRIDGLGAIFTAALACYLIYGRPIGAGNAGFSLNMTVELCTVMIWWVRSFNEFEVQSNSLERIQAYIDIEHEPKATETNKPPAAWPTSGDLRVENLSARYSQTGPAVLHNLSFHIKSGQRIGVGASLGRTGSGKSSLTLALLRCILTEGTVYYDGIPTSQINLDALRSNITIIPQTPELLSGTLRRNLDPFQQHDDATLNDALRSAGLFSLQAELEEARLTLDSNVASSGSNLSVGQRQIIALARAIVRASKLLILDEATSAIDYKTDSIIQTTLRYQMSSNVTIITIAHRLQTIMDADKIMVLDNGRIVEFDSPITLLQKTDGFLKSLVDGSGDKDALYAMAAGKPD